MLLIEANNIDYRYDSQTELLLSDINLKIYKNTKTGITGINGCGKSTLIKILTEELTPYRGFIRKKEDLRIGYLPQNISISEKLTVEEYFFNHLGLLELKKRYDDAINGLNNDPLIYTEYEEKHGFDIELRIEKLLKLLKLDESVLKQKISLLSGGEKTKINVGKLLLNKPDILILDEPTNNLDSDSLMWLEEFLNDNDLTWLAISHDRTFLDNCVNEIWEIEDTEMRVWTGNYSAYKLSKEMEFERQMKLYEKQKKKIRQIKKVATDRKKWALSHQGETGTNGYAPIYEAFRNKASKVMKRAKAAETRLNKLIEDEESKKPFIKKDHSFEFKNSGLNTRKMLRIKNLSKSFGDRTLFEDLNLDLNRGDKLCITGKNGCGKSTLIKILLDKMDYDEGEFSWTDQIKMAYLNQDLNNKDLKGTGISVITGGDKLKETEARTFLACLKLPGKMHNNDISTFSPGELKKIILTKLLLSESNILILDEPENHLEIESREKLEDALLKYEGCIIFTSHDRYFVNKIANKQLSL